LVFLDDRLNPQSRANPRKPDRLNNTLFGCQTGLRFFQLEKRNMKAPSDAAQPPESAGGPDVTVYETLMETARVEEEAQSTNPLDDWVLSLRTSDQIIETD
jgi:hypothetical protein